LDTSIHVIRGLNRRRTSVSRSPAADERLATSSPIATMLRATALIPPPKEVNACSDLSARAAASWSLAMKLLAASLCEEPPMPDARARV
jgi:hypothetical protein